MTEAKCGICFEHLGDWSEYGGISGKSAQWWADKALYEHVDELHS